MSANRAGTGFLLIAASVLVAGTSVAAEKLILATSAPPQHWASVNGAEPFMACARKASNNGLDFNYFPGGQLSNANNALEIVNDGLVQISYLSISNLSGKMPLLAITMMPGMGDSVVHITKAARRAIEVEGPFKKEFDDNKVRLLWLTYFPPLQLVMKGGPIEVLKDIQGKKFLSGGTPITLALRALGGTPAEIPVSDMYMSIQRGTVDGAALSLASVKPYRVQEIAKSMTTNAHIGNGLAVWVIDQAVFNRLSPANQKVINDCGLQTEVNISKWVDDMSAKLASEFAAAGVKMYTLSPDNRTAFAKRLEPSVDEYVRRLAKRGLPSQQALNMIRAELAK